MQIILEEAHRYVQNDNDINTIGYNIFDRITKEGRKYGVILGLITQRPSELSNTALSQCSNYLVLRMFHPADLEIVKNITHSISETDVERLKTLRPGVALCFGNAFNITVFNFLLSSLYLILISISVFKSELKFISKNGILMVYLNI